MCRSIKTLFNYQPPATEDEIKAASLQFVRKISGYNKPSHANEAAFEPGGGAGRRRRPQAAGFAGNQRRAEGPRGRGRARQGAGSGALRHLLSAERSSSARTARAGTWPTAA